MKRIMALCAAALFVFVSTSAQAKHHHYRRYAHHRVHAVSHIIHCGRFGCNDRVEPKGERFVERIETVVYEGRVVGGRPAGCPHAFCGCGTSLHIFGRIIPELNLAANWRRFPSASPAPGMVAWRWGHVFAIESVNGDGTVVAYDPNSGGHRTRVHTVSLRGFHVVNPHGERMASR